MENNGKVYRITIEPIGEEEEELNNGAPMIIETGGFMIIGCTETVNDDEKIGLEISRVIHQINIMEIAKGLKDWDRFGDMMKALLMLSIEDRFKEV